MRPYLDIEELNIALKKSSDLRLLRDVNLQITRGETYGVLGQSLAGKTLIVKTLFGLLSPVTKIISGRVYLDGEDLLCMKELDRQDFVSRRIALVPSDPIAALNPLKNIGKQMMQLFARRRHDSKENAYRHVLDAFAKMAVVDPEKIFKQYPHQLSSALCQKILISAALMVAPDLIIVDESAVLLNSVQRKQNLRLLAKEKNSDTSLLLLSHDVGMITTLCPRLTVLYEGYLVEQINAKSFEDSMRDSYLKAMLKMMPNCAQPHLGLALIDGELSTKIVEEITLSDEKWCLRYGK